MSEWDVGVVYKIICMPTGTIYIGTTSNDSFASRMKVHFKQLRGDAHPNRRMQEAFNQFGEDAFAIKIIRDNLSKEDRCALESKLIREYSSEEIFNQRNIGSRKKMNGYGSTDFIIDEIASKLFPTDK